MALNAFGGGVYGMSGAQNVPREWLEGSPFDDYFVPALILFVGVGGSMSAAAIAAASGGREWGVVLGLIAAVILLDRMLFKSRSPATRRSSSRCSLRSAC